MATKHYLYILQSLTSQRLYVGQTQDLAARVEYHNRYGNRATRHRGPWKLVYWEGFARRGEALQRERDLKRKKSHQYLQWLVRASR
ncbi:MAG: GIY-YIG nuclease family protein [Acidobacteria bacterium]|nr:GIY-YIG nuclease family protein [Acidobacteriota bacterium]